MNKENTINQLKQDGYGVIPPQEYRIDIEKEFLAIWEKSAPFTMISMERGYSIFKSVEYICKRKISGDFVECGVWKGGASMIAALSLLHFKPETYPTLWLYDTYEGMTEPTQEDKIAWNESEVHTRWQNNNETGGWWAVNLEDVQNNLKNTGYPAEKLKFIKGDVLETLEKDIPREIALLRLDTDWYESTKRELELLYPLLNHGCPLIIDDYGHFTGAKKAVDHYFAQPDKFILFNRIDYTGRTGIKV